MENANEIDHEARKARFMNASAELAATLEPAVLALWIAESHSFTEAVERGENITMSPLWLAIAATIWAHVTDGETLDFPPELAAHYHRAPRAHLN
jgi:hypothetical protein